LGEGVSGVDWAQLKPTTTMTTQYEGMNSCAA